jgi:hypothetical protein
MGRALRATVRGVGGRSHPLRVVTRNEPDTPLRDQNEPVPVRARAYTRPMKTAEIRGIPPRLRGSGTTQTAFICSWFEFRYHSSKRLVDRGFVVDVMTTSAELLVTTL